MAMAAGTIGGMTEQDLVGLVDRRIGELVAGQVLEFRNSEIFRQKMIAVVEPAIGEIARDAEATLKQAKEEFVKMQALTTQLDEKLAEMVQELANVRLAGVKFDQNAQEQMLKVEENIARINEAQRRPSTRRRRQSTQRPQGRPTQLGSRL